jgi:hypothetical protein
MCLSAFLNADKTHAHERNLKGGRMSLGLAGLRLIASHVSTLTILCVCRVAGSKHPDAPVILDHFMGCAARPDLDDLDPSVDNLEKLCEMGRRHANCYAKLGPLDHFSSSEAPPFLDMLPVVSRLLDAFGPARCMWESDSGGPGCPLVVQKDLGYDMSSAYEGSISLITEHCRLSEAEVHLVLGGTAVRVFMSFLLFSDQICVFFQRSFGRTATQACRNDALYQIGGIAVPCGA